MTEKIADRQISIQCRFRIISVQSCVIRAGYGQHTRAEVTRSWTGTARRAS